ncbi:MAG: hypothetical protein PVF87_08010 [Acidimicrobiia bacterium]
MGDSERAKPGTWARNAIARFVSKLNAGLPWFDTHLPLVPVPVRSGHLVLLKL